MLAQLPNPVVMHPNDSYSNFSHRDGVDGDVGAGAVVDVGVGTAVNVCSMSVPTELLKMEHGPLDPPPKRRSRLYRFSVQILHTSTRAALSFAAQLPNAQRMPRIGNAILQGRYCQVGVGPVMFTRR